jgi:hypothetical protein
MTKKTTEKITPDTKLVNSNLLAMIIFFRMRIKGLLISPGNNPHNSVLEYLPLTIQ